MKPAFVRSWLSIKYHVLRPEQSFIVNFIVIAFRVEQPLIFNGSLIKHASLSIFRSLTVKRARNGMLSGAWGIPAQALDAGMDFMPYNDRAPRESLATRAARRRFLTDTTRITARMCGI
jgi:hypothetical protein